MQRFYETVFDTLTGAAVAGAQVFVFDSGNNLATIYSDPAGLVVAANPMISDSNGFVECYATDGLYNLDFRSGGVSLRTINNIPIFDLADMRADRQRLQARMATVEAAIIATNAQVATNAAAIAALTNARYYNFGAFAASGILASEILLDHVVAVANTLAANFANAQVSVGTNPGCDVGCGRAEERRDHRHHFDRAPGVVTMTTVGGTAKRWPLVTW
jgi:hypothetical protein